MKRLLSALAIIALASSTAAVAGDHQDRQNEVSVQEALDTTMPADQKDAVFRTTDGAAPPKGVGQAKTEQLRQMAIDAGGASFAKKKDGQEKPAEPDAAVQAHAQGYFERIKQRGAPVPEG